MRGEHVVSVNENRGNVDHLALRHVRYSHLEHLQFASSERFECSCVVICLSVVSTRIWTVFRVFV